MIAGVAVLAINLAGRLLAGNETLIVSVKPEAGFDGEGDGVVGF